MKPKVINLFSKNHIIFTKTIGISPVEPSLETKGNSLVIYRHLYLKSRKVVRKKSVLGFYYDSETCEYYKERSGETVKQKELKFNYNGEVYNLSYIIEYEGSIINVELRPWNIHPGDKSMPDHFVDDLLNLLNKYFTEVPEIKEYKSEVFKDLFGYPEGPKYQTDEEKILSHGFDLKESFRKPKES